ncbi:MAG: RecX family transcriptional regulator [Erysipelotrichaceae bacterium]|nr:RecX family transcriptional regulator [Erysipelotrichaceae bacterium]
MKLEDFLTENRIETDKDIKYEIRRIKATEDYVLLFLEEEKIMISLENYFKYNVKNLKGLDDELYEHFKKDEKLLKAYRGCLRKLSSKDHTVKQIRDYLYRYELKRSEIEDLIKRLKEYGLLDDEKYCIGKIGYYQNSLYSARQIRMKLLKDGINEELINKHLSNENEYEKVLKLAEKYARDKGKSVKALKQSILIKLTGNGYSYDNASKAVESLNINNENELELLSKEYAKALRKYEKKYEDYELRNHIYAYLLNKGFRSDDIKEVMEEQDG